MRNIRTIHDLICRSSLERSLQAPMDLALSKVAQALPNDAKIVELQRERYQRMPLNVALNELTTKLVADIEDMQRAIVGFETAVNEVAERVRNVGTTEAETQRCY